MGASYKAFQNRTTGPVNHLQIIAGNAVLTARLSRDGYS